VGWEGRVRWEGEGKGGEGRGAGEKGRGRSSPNVRDALTPLVSGVENIGQCGRLSCSAGFWAHFNIVTYLLTADESRLS